MKLGEQSIFPLPEANIGGAHFNATSGMTLRQYLAGLAMQGIMSVGNGTGSWNSLAQIDAAAIDAVKAADALLAELEK